jgi:5-formyltetrahydrofolate cyclo-ligase
MDLAAIKKSARKQAAQMRAEAHERLKDEAAAALAARGLPAAISQPPRIISGFIAYKSEINTAPLMNRLRREGWRTALPVVMGEGLPLVFRLWKPGEPLVPGVWDIPIPPDTTEDVEPDVLLVPGLSYDRKGYRLGYGGGFYDRTLEKLREVKPVVAIGVAYHAQIVDQVPRGEHDAPLDYIVTDEETIACG